MKRLSGNWNSPKMSKILDLEKCPCGSNCYYNDCCKNRPDSLEPPPNPKNKIETNKYFERNFKNANLKQCIHPDKSDCSQGIIRAHSIQNNKILSRLSENGEIMTVSFEDENQSVLNFNLSAKGRKTATTFFGFCSKHDSKTFSPIENFSYNCSEQQNFLFTYRAFAYEYHKKLEQIKLFQFLVSKKPSILKDENYVGYYRGMQFALKDAQFYYEKFSKALKELRFDHVQTVSFSIDNYHEFAVCSGFNLEFDLNGKQINVPNAKSRSAKQIYLNVFPEDGKTHVLLSCLKHDSSTFHPVFEQFKSLDSQERLNYLNNLIPMYSENVVLAPRLWQSWNVEAQQDFIKSFELSIKSPFFLDFRKDVAQRNTLYNLFNLIAS